MKILFQYKVKNHNVKDGHTYGLPDLIIELLRFLNLTLRDCQNKLYDYYTMVAVLYYW